jgi:hypothetical protein
VVSGQKHIGFRLGLLPASRHPHPKYSNPAASIGPKSTLSGTPWFTTAKMLNPPKIALPFPDDEADHRSAA